MRYLWRITLKNAPTTVLDFKFTTVMKDHQITCIDGKTIYIISNANPIGDVRRVFGRVVASYQQERKALVV